MKLFKSSFISFLCAAWALPLCGQTSLSLSPVQLEFTLDAGKSEPRVLTVGNDSSKAVRVKAEIIAWAMGTPGVDVFPAEGAPGLTCRDWILVNHPEIIVQPGEYLDVPFVVSVPENTEPGQYTAAISFGTMSEEATGEHAEGLQLQGRLSAQMMVTVGKPRDEGTVENLAAENKDGRNVLVIRRKNSSRFYLPTEGEIILRNQKGKKVYTAEFIDDPVPPLSARIFWIPIEEKLSPGSYQAECVLRLLTGKKASFKGPIVID